MKTLAKKLKTVLKTNKEIIDIIFFGSTVKGKIRATDLDVAIIFEGSLNRRVIKEKIETSLKKKIDLQLISIKDYDQFIWITLLREGYSVKHNKYLHEQLRIKPVVLYKYSLKPLGASKKVMFERAIKIIDGIEKLSNRVVLVPINVSGRFSEFLKSWDIDFESQEYGLLPLVRKEEF